MSVGDTPRVPQDASKRIQGAQGNEVISGELSLDRCLLELVHHDALMLLLSETGTVSWCNRRVGAVSRDGAVGLTLGEFLERALSIRDPSTSSTGLQDAALVMGRREGARAVVPALLDEVATVARTGVPARVVYPARIPYSQVANEYTLFLSQAPRAWPAGFRIWAVVYEARNETSPRNASYSATVDIRGANGSTEGVVEVASTVDSSQLRLALEASGVGLWSYDLRDDILTLDQSVLGTLGFRPEGHARRWSSMHAVVNVDDRSLVDAALERSRESGLYGPIEYRVIRPDGEEAWVYSQARVHRDQAGQARTLVGGVLDITDRRRLQVQLAEAQKLESVARLAGGVAHDFNNMLTVILSYADSLLRELDDAGPQRAYVQEIRQAARRSAALTSQLLAFARRQISEPMVVDLNGLIDGIRRLLLRVLGEGVTLVLELELEEVPCIEIDPTMLEQAIVNLALNARAAMPEGGTLTLATQLRTTKSAGQRGVTEQESGGERVVSLAISDTGLGIPPEEQAHVFEPFYTTRGREGTGLGLAMVHGVVTQAGGSITLVSEPQVGTRVELLFPASALRPHIAEPAFPTTRQHRDATILVVEDESAVRAAVCSALREAGFVVVETSGAPEAIGLLKRDPGKISCVVSDVVMPQLNGLQLAAILRSIRPRLPVLLVSAYTETRIAAGAGLGENMEFLAKPFIPAVLVRRVEQLIARTQQLEEA